MSYIYDVEGTLYRPSTLHTRQDLRLVAVLRLQPIVGSVVSAWPLIPATHSRGYSLSIVCQQLIHCL